MKFRNHQRKRLKKNGKRQQKHHIHTSLYHCKFSSKWKRQKSSKNKNVRRRRRHFDRGQKFSCFKHYYVEMSYGKMLLAFLFIFLLSRPHLQNTDLRIWLAVYLFQCQLVQRLRQMASMLLCTTVHTQSLPARRPESLVHTLPARWPESLVHTLPARWHKSQAGMSCRLQYLQGYRSDQNVCGFQHWLCISSWKIGGTEADGKAEDDSTPLCQPHNKKHRKEKPECYFLEKANYSYSSSLKMVRKISRNIIDPLVSDILMYPTDNDLSDFFKSLEIQPLPDEVEQLKYEWKRVITFGKCIGDISAVRLAKNGFYFAGDAQNPCLTRCYSCKLENDSWEFLSKPEEFHRKNSPHCRHLASMSASVSSPNEPPLTSVTSGVRSSGACGVSTQASAAGAFPKNLPQGGIGQGSSTRSLPQGAIGTGSSTRSLPRGAVGTGSSTRSLPQGAVGTGSSTRSLPQGAVETGSAACGGARMVISASAAMSMPPPQQASSVSGTSVIPQVALASSPPITRPDTGHQNKVHVSTVEPL